MDDTSSRNSGRLSAASNTRRYGGVLPEERRRRRRGQFILGAIEVFGTKGFHASTVHEVCVAAQLTERYFYESFKTLPALFLAAYEALRDQLMQLTLAAMGQTEDGPLAMFEPAAHVLLEFIREDPRRGRILLIDAFGINDEVIAASDNAVRDYVSMMRTMLPKLMPELNQDHVSIDLLASGMVGLNMLVAVRWMQGGFAEPIDVVVRTSMLPYRALLVGSAKEKA